MRLFPEATLRLGAPCWEVPRPCGHRGNPAQLMSAPEGATGPLIQGKGLVVGRGFSPVGWALQWGHRVDGPLALSHSSIDGHWVASALGLLCLMMI